MNAKANDNSLGPIIRLYPDMLSIGNREGDRFGLQIVWPTVLFRRDNHNRRKEFFIAGLTTFRVVWGNEICLGVSFCGFGLGILILPNDPKLNYQATPETPPNTEAASATQVGRLAWLGLAALQMAISVAIACMWPSINTVIWAFLASTLWLFSCHYLGSTRNHRRS